MSSELANWQRQASELRAHGPRVHGLRGSMANELRADELPVACMANELRAGELPAASMTYELRAGGHPGLVNTSRMQIVQPKLVHIVRF